MFRSTMQVARRFAGIDLDLIADAGMAITGVTLAALAAWTPWGAAAIGPVWLRAVLPLLVGVAAGAAPPSAARHVDRDMGGYRAPIRYNEPSARGLGVVRSLRRRLFAWRARQPAPFGSLRRRQRGHDHRGPVRPVCHPARGCLASRRLRLHPSVPDGEERGTAAAGRAGRGRPSAPGSPGSCTISSRIT